MGRVRADAWPDSTLARRKLEATGRLAKASGTNKFAKTGLAHGVRSRARRQEKPQEYSRYFEDFSEDESRERTRGETAAGQFICARCLSVTLDPSRKTGKIGRCYRRWAYQGPWQRILWRMAEAAGKFWNSKSKERKSKALEISSKQK